MKRETLIRLAGTVWLLIGFMLLSMGIRFLRLSSVESLYFWVAPALGVGYLKGNFMLKKSVKKQVARISQLSEPTHIKQIYSRGYYILIGSMMALGMSLRFLPVSLAVRGAVDIAIGFALFNGALQYYRASRVVRTGN